MKKFFAEFKEFIAKGNVLDMAVGVIVGGAFGKITSTLVANVITPLLAFLFNSPNTDALNITLRAADEAAGTEAIVLGLGTFVGAIIDFVVIAFVLFLIIKSFNKMRAIAEAKKKAEEAEPEPEPEAEPEPSAEEKLLTEIRDLLKNK
ncbi:MAG: large conductance mechanosensitive channel protein MscL [Oscillospiraceae bacterium]|nr:large conductance mechanosensitive channel protein MscL [Oscillospiraceae bacterium]